jgi:hypothetical protein
MLQLSPRAGITIIAIVILMMWFASDSGEKIDPTIHMSDPDFKQQEWTMVNAGNKIDNGRYFTGWINEDNKAIEIECSADVYPNFKKGLVYEKKAGQPLPVAISEKPIAVGNTDYGSYSNGSWVWHRPYYSTYYGYPTFSFFWRPHPYRSYWYYRRPWSSRFGGRWHYRTHHRGWGGYNRSYVRNRRGRISSFSSSRRSSRGSSFRRSSFSSWGGK